MKIKVWLLFTIWNFYVLITYNIQRKWNNGNENDI